MDELTGPIVAITLVLSSVFLPSCFIPGLTGQFYRQFALTIAASVIISAVNAMTLTPSRAVSIFKTEETSAERAGSRPAPAEQRSPPLVDLRDRRRAAHRLAGAALPGRPPGPAGGACRGGELAATMVVLGCHVQPRPAGWSRGRLVPHRPRQRRAGLVLPGLQPPLRRRHRRLRLDGRQAAAPERDRAGGLRRPARADLVAGGERADRLHPHAGSGLSARQRPVAGLAPRCSGPTRSWPRSTRLPAASPAWPTPSASPGKSFLTTTNGSNLGTMFVGLKPFEQRTRGRIRRGDRREDPAAVQSGDRGRHRQRLSGAAHPGPGQRRRLQASDRAARLRGPRASCKR